VRRGGGRAARIIEGGRVQVTPDVRMLADTLLGRHPGFKDKVCPAVRVGGMIVVRAATDRQAVGRSS
jgi:hypothetical protein